MIPRKGIENLSFTRIKNMNEYKFNLNNVTRDTKGKYRCRMGYLNRTSNKPDILNVNSYYNLKCENTPTFKCSQAIECSSSMFVSVTGLFIALIVLDFY